MRTQVQILRRLTVAVVVVVALGAALLSFPGVRTVGASLLASAGLISVIAGLAAQSTLANVFAGSSSRSRRDPHRRRGGRGGGVGLDRGDHAELCRRAAVGRPADGAALDVLHEHAVPELDPAQLRAARRRRDGRRLAGRRGSDARRAPADRGAHRPVGRPDAGAAGDRRAGGTGAGACPGHRRRRGHPVRPAVPRARAAGVLGAAGRRCGTAAGPRAAGRGPGGGPRADRDSDQSGVFSGDEHAERRGERFRRTTERPE